MTIQEQIAFQNGLLVGTAQKGFISSGGGRDEKFYKFEEISSDGKHKISTVIDFGMTDLNVLQGTRDLLSFLKGLGLISDFTEDLGTSETDRRFDIGQNKLNATHVIVNIKREAGRVDSAEIRFYGMFATSHPFDPRPVDSVYLHLFLGESHSFYIEGIASRRGSMLLQMEDKPFEFNVGLHSDRYQLSYLKTSDYYGESVDVVKVFLKDHKYIGGLAIYGDIEYSCTYNATYMDPNKYDNLISIRSYRVHTGTRYILPLYYDDLYVADGADEMLVINSIYRINNKKYYKYDRNTLLEI